MKIGLLTTDTPHHRHFVREIARYATKPAEIAFVMFETAGYPWNRKAKTHFRTSFPNLWKGLALNPYLQSAVVNGRIETYERARFFPDGDDSLPAHIPIAFARSVNDEQAARFFDAHPCDIFFMYGTGKVKPHVFRRPAVAAVNAHGGLLPAYRGLDTNLWAALLGKPEDMAVALHQVEADFDTGALYAQERLGPVAGLSLVSLRYFTTLRIVEMTLPLFERFASGRAAVVPQSGGGSYFGPMPLLQKYKAGRVIKSFAAESAHNPVFVA